MRDYFHSNANLNQMHFALISFYAYVNLAVYSCMSKHMHLMLKSKASVETDFSTKPLARQNEKNNGAIPAAERVPKRKLDVTAKLSWMLKHIFKNLTEIPKLLVSLIMVTGIFRSFALRKNSKLCKNLHVCLKIISIKPSCIYFQQLLFLSLWPILKVKHIESLHVVLVCVFSWLIY